MPLPLKIPGLSAADDLGMGSMLSEEVAGETDELRKKRMAQMHERSMLTASGGSLASMSLFGMGGGLGGSLS